MKKHKRWNIFIQKDMQGKLTFQYFLLCAVGLSLLTLLFSWLSADNLTITYQNQRLQIAQTPLVAFRDMFRSNWVFLLAIVSFLALVSLWLTHRIAGPTYRFQKTLEMMLKKDLNQHIILRPKDEGKAIAEQFNTFNGMLSDDLRQVKTWCEEMAICMGVASEGENSDKDLERAETLNGMILEKLDTYRLKNGVG